MLFFFNPFIKNHGNRNRFLYNIFQAYSRKDYLSDGRQIVFEISLVLLCE